MQYADVIIDISHEKVDRPFQYRVPQALESRLTVGMQVAVPFGRGNQRRCGYVIALGSECELEPSRIKELYGIVADGVTVEGRLIQLAAWIRQSYGGTMIQALKTVLPVKRAVKQLTRRRVELTAGREEAVAALGEAIRKKQTARQRLLTELLGEEVLPYELVVGKLHISASTIASLERSGLVRVVTDPVYRDPVGKREREEQRKTLSSSQRLIVDSILMDYDRGRRGTYLIHGITGSGKTEVYMALIEQVVQRGRQAIFLIPEISLTYQTLVRFYRRFGDRVSVLNSSLSQGEKYDQCQRARNGELDVIIGPRSALFTPFPDVGLIVIDEEHEGSYKSETTPRYHARETAGELARLCGASLVLGSATPSLEAYYRAMRGEYGLFTLKERLTGGSLPKVWVADLREELAEGNRSVFSRKLQELLEQRLSSGEQSMLFLNRRGYAGFLSCRSCGYVMKCPHCDVSLSEHKGGRMICHYCGYETQRPTGCPKCGSRYFSGFRAGTQQIEDKLLERFPGVRVLRMDADTTRTKGSYEKILASFANGEADVLVGTQMIVKGHDFPNVTLVGIIAADLSLSVGDFRAGERTFQLLTQAAGRAGRGDAPGEVVIQTYQPEHYAVALAARQDYEAFYREEMAYRELLSYPPVAHMLAVQIFSGDEESGRRLAERLAGEASRFVDQTKDISHRLQLMGPAPAAIGKVNDVFRFVFYLKHEEYGVLVEIRDALERTLAQWQPRRETVQFDFDPVVIF